MQNNQIIWDLLKARCVFCWHPFHPGKLPAGTPKSWMFGFSMIFPFHLGHFKVNHALIFRGVYRSWLFTLELPGFLPSPRQDYVTRNQVDGSAAAALKVWSGKRWESQVLKGWERREFHEQKLIFVILKQMVFFFLSRGPTLKWVPSLWVFCHFDLW